MGYKDPQEREEYEEPMLGIFHGLLLRSTLDRNGRRSNRIGRGEAE